MPRDGSGVYSLPAGSTATAGTTITASTHNTPLADLVSDANAARPVVAGGTGATTAANARTNLAVPGLAVNNTFTGNNDFTAGETSVATPTGSAHATTKGYVDSNFVSSSAGIPLLKSEQAISSDATITFNTNFSASDREIIFDLFNVSPSSATTTGLQMSVTMSSSGARDMKYTVTVFDEGVLEFAKNYADSVVFLTGNSSNTSKSPTNRSGDGVIGAIHGRIRIQQYATGNLPPSLEWELFYQDSDGFTSSSDDGMNVKHVRGGGYIEQGTGGEYISAVAFTVNTGTLEFGRIRHLVAAS